MTYCELTDIKRKFDNEGIKYEEVRINEAIFVYVNGLMQIQKPTEKQRKQFWPEVRISKHEGDEGYYVKACGAIYKNTDIEEIMKLIGIYVINEES